MREAPDAPHEATSEALSPSESDTAGCLRSYLPAAAAGLKPAERGPGGGLTATYCTQLGNYARACKNATPPTRNAHLSKQVCAKMNRSWAKLGPRLASWGPLEGLGGLSEPLGSLLGASWELLGGSLGASWLLLGVSWEPLGGLLDVPGGVLGQS